MLGSVLLLPLAIGLAVAVALYRLGPPRSRPFVPAVAVALADVGWRVASRLLGLDPLPGVNVWPSELGAPWPPAVLVGVLAALLLAQPGRGAAIALGAVEAVRFVLTAIPFALRAMERLRGWGMFDPGRPDPWASEILHLVLHAAAVVLLFTGYRGHLRARGAEARAAVGGAFG